jgi:hypothetical protein
MDARDGIDALIVQEDRLVTAVVRLLLDEAPWSAWPRDAVSSLAGAIAVGGEDPREDAKADRLRHHLFFDLPALEPNGALRRSRSAERLRADLAVFVPVGAGLHLVDEKKLAASVGYA